MKPLLEERNRQILRDFNKWKARHYETSYVLTQLSRKYYLSRTYLMKIIKGRV